MNYMDMKVVGFDKLSQKMLETNFFSKLFQFLCTKIEDECNTIS